MITADRYLHDYELSPSDRYEVLEKSHHHGPFIVHRGYDREICRDVAIWFFTPDLANESSVDVADIRQVAALSHPNLLRVLDVDSQRRLVVTEWMPNNLAEICRRRNLQPGELRRVIQQVLQSLGYLHAEGLMHGRVSAESIFTDDDLQNFKLECLAVNPSSGPFRPPFPGDRHIAPELLDPTFGDPGCSSDLYCLGVTAYELSLGSKLPNLLSLPASKSLDQAWLQWHRTDDVAFPSIRKAQPKLDADVGRVIERMTVKDSRARLDSASAALQLLADGAADSYDRMPVSERKSNSNSAGKMGRLWQGVVSSELAFHLKSRPKSYAVAACLLVVLMCIAANSFTGVAMIQNEETDGSIRVAGETGITWTIDKNPLMGTIDSANKDGVGGNLAPGVYSVTASKDGYEPQTKEARIDAGETTTVMFDLKRNACTLSISAHFESTRTDKGNQLVSLDPLEDAEIFVRNQRKGSFGTPQRKAADWHLQAGSYEIRIEHPRLKAYSGVLEVIDRYRVPDESQTTDGTKTFEAGYEIVLEDYRGRQPVQPAFTVPLAPRARMLIVRVAGRPNCTMDGRRLTPKDDQVFLMETEPYGSDLLQITCDGFEPFVETVDFSNESVAKPMVVTMERMKMPVVSFQSLPVDNAEVYDPTGKLLGRTPFHMAMPPGARRFFVKHTGYPESYFDLSVPDTESTLAMIRLRP